jgi:hypothetical protein
MKLAYISKIFYHSSLQEPTFSDAIIAMLYFRLLIIKYYEVRVTSNDKIRSKLRKSRLTVLKGERGNSKIKKDILPQRTALRCQKPTLFLEERIVA